jgi:hypothetical protein
MIENMSGPREKLDDLLMRIGREPASEWGFKTEREKMFWVLGKMVEVFTTRAQTALDNAEKRLKARKALRQDARRAANGGAGAASVAQPKS